MLAVLLFTDSDYSFKLFLRNACVIINYGHVPFVTYHRIFYKSNTTGAINGAGLPEFTSFWRGTCCLTFSLCSWPLFLFVVFFWPLCCLSFFFDLRILIITLVSSNFWPLCCLFFFDLRILITTLVSSTFDHCVVCPSSIYRFWLSRWYLLTFDHCVVCPSLIYGFWLPLWYLQLLTIALSVLLRFTDSDYHFGIFNFWPLRCLFFDLRILITTLVSSTFDHCVVCPSIYGFWLPLWYLQLLTIALSVLLRFTDSDYHFGIFNFWPLRCLFFDLRILITTLVSSTFDHCVVCPSSIYGFWLPLWYPQLLTIALSVLLRFTDSDYHFGIFNFWPLRCLFFFDLRILITTLVSSTFDHCVVCPSSIYGFWLPLWYLQPLTIALSVLRFTDSDYHFGIFNFWPLRCLSFFDLRILITTLVSSTFDHCVVCPSSIYGFWLPLWYLQTLLV